MENQTGPIPEGYHSLTPYLIVKDAARAIEWYKKALGAEELFRMDKEDRIGHAELRIGDSRFMLADEFPEIEAIAPSSGGRSFSLVLYVENVDEVFDQAVDFGAIILHPLKDQSYGDRMGTIRDPFGHNWSIGTQIEKH